MFEWDEAKRLWTIAEHGLDLLDAVLVFDGRRVVHLTARLGNGPHMLSIAEINGKF